jgi:hypothetical protein
MSNPVTKPRLTEPEVRHLLKLADEVDLPLDLATSNSFRRVVDASHAEVLGGTVQQDGHPDLRVDPAVRAYLLAAANAFPRLATEWLRAHTECEDYCAALRICTDALLELGATDVLDLLVPHIGTPLNPKHNEPL